LFPEELKEPVRAFNAVKRFGSPKEAVDVIAWLVGERNNHIVSAVLVASYAWESLVGSSANDKILLLN
jgi:hypothetical protein